MECLQKRIVHQGGASWQALECEYRGVAQSGSASGLGPEGRRFESYRPDHKNKKGLVLRGLFLFLSVAQLDRATTF